MSIFSDYECGAMTDVEFNNACVEMNARERWEEEHYRDTDSEDEEEQDDEEDIDYVD